MKPRTKQSDIDLLRWAINEATAWRGSMPPEQQVKFDALIQDALTALDVVRTDLRTLRRIKSKA